MAKEKICGIYKIENLVDGKVYIGQSINVSNRLANHKSDLKHNKLNWKEITTWIIYYSP